MLHQCSISLKLNESSIALFHQSIHLVLYNIISVSLLWLFPHFVGRIIQMVLQWNSRITPFKTVSKSLLCKFPMKQLITFLLVDHLRKLYLLICKPVRTSFANKSVNNSMKSVSQILPFKEEKKTLHFPLSCSHYKKWKKKNFLIYSSSHLWCLTLQYTPQLHIVFFKFPQRESVSWRHWSSSLWNRQDYC